MPVCGFRRSRCLSPGDLTATIVVAYCGFSHGQDAAALVDVDFAVICGPARGKEAETEAEAGAEAAAESESESECEVADGQTVFDVRRRCNFKITFLPLPVGRWPMADHRLGQLLLHIDLANCQPVACLKINS